MKVNAQPQARLTWAKNMGGIAYDGTQAIALDDSGNIYTAGYFQGKADFNPGSATFNLTSAGSADIFVSKLNAQGNFVWAKRIGGTGEDIAYSLALDDSGNVYVTGFFESKVDFDPGTGTFNLTCPGLKDVFVLKLNNSGNFSYAKQIGGIKEETGYSLALDDSANIYITGFFQDSVDFNPGAGKYTLYTDLSGCIFVSKLNRAGNFIWAKQMGAINNGSVANCIALDDSGYVYTTGKFNGTSDFDPGSGKFTLTASGTLDIFISKLSRAGKFVWAVKLGGTADYEEGLGITTDKHGSVYTTGYFSGKSDFDPGTSSYFLTSSGGNDIFVSKLTRSGIFEWAIKTGAGGDERATAIEVDDSCCTYIIGDEEDIILSKLDSTGKTLWKEVFSSSFSDRGNCITLDSSHNIYFSGYFSQSIDFDPSRNKSILISNGYYDIFIQKMKQCYANSSNITVKACNSYLVPSKRKIHTTSGSYTDTLTNMFGCDSVIFIKLTILKKTTSSINVKACNFYKSPSNKYQWTTSAVYLDTITNGAGCDSIITINLTVSKINTSFTFNASACYNYISPSKKYKWIKSGSYKDTIPNKVNCDSVITINLTILNNTTFGSISPFVCENYKSPSNRYTWTVSGIYKDTLVNKSGCDSIITIYLTVNSKSSSTISPSVCRSYTSPSRKYTWTLSGKYTDIIPNATGCDSVITINLKIKTNTYGSINKAVCGSYTSPSKKYIWTNSGSYKDTIPNKAGCDSIISVLITINKSTLATISPNVCRKYVSPSKKYIWTTSGTFYDTIKNKAGCDSFITIKLSVNKTDVTVTNNSPLLTANTAGAAYQWLDCNKGFVKISGANKQSYTALKNGSYAVEITQNTCADTSACYMVSNVAISNPTIGSEVQVYPNPTSGKVNIFFNRNFENGTVLVFDLLGQLVLQKEFNSKTFDLDIVEAKGVYFMHLNCSDGRSSIFKIIKY